MKELLRKEREEQVHVSLKTTNYSLYFLRLKTGFLHACSKIAILLCFNAKPSPFKRKLFSALIPFLQSLRNTTTP